MLYNPTTQGLYCPYCDNTREIKKFPTRLRGYHEERSQSVVDDKSKAHKCPNCGGEIDFDSYVTSKKCPYCSATNVIKLDDLEGLQPDSILPFLLTKDMACEAGTRWIKKKAFALGSFKKNFKPESFNGVYVPSYLFSSDTYTKYKARLGEHYTVTVGSGKNRRTETRTRWFTVSGELSKYFSDIIVEATKQLTQDEMNRISPYDTENLVGYQKEYIAGFSSESNDASLDEGLIVAKDLMDSEIQRSALSRYRYDVVGSFDAQTSYTAIGFRYALMPIWIFECKHKEKNYRYIVNGRTGRSYGKYPLSVGKIMAVVLAVLAVVATFVFIYLSNSGLIQI